MNILILIGHPAHVHFFKNFIVEMKNKGHNIGVCSINKDVAVKLLDAYNIDYQLLLSDKNFHHRLIFKQFKKYINIFSIAKKFRPDIITGIGGTAVAHIGKVLGCKSIIFTDTEHAKFANSITFPFTDAILTPSCYKENIGKKQIRYNGFHELAYLHPNHFKPNPGVLEEIGLTKDDPLIIIRFVSWQASHDIGQQGIRDKFRLVKELEKHGRVLITSEAAVPEELEIYQIRVSPEKIHDLLFYSSLYIGEGATMAAEAAVLGIPSIYISSLAGTMGNFIELEKKYDLLYSFVDWEMGLKKSIEVMKDTERKAEWKKKRETLLKDKIDVTAFIIWFFENFPESKGILIENPDIQKKFQIIRQKLTNE